MQILWVQMCRLQCKFYWGGFQLSTDQHCILLFIQSHNRHHYFALLSYLLCFCLWHYFRKCLTNKPASKNNNRSFSEPGTTGKYNNDNILRKKKKVTYFTEKQHLASAKQFMADRCDGHANARWVNIRRPAQTCRGESERHFSWELIAVWEIVYS